MERWEEGGRIKDGETGDLEDEGMKRMWRGWRQKDGRMGEMEEKWRGRGVENEGMGRWRKGRLKSEGNSKMEDRGMGKRWEHKRWRNRRDER